MKKRKGKRFLAAILCVCMVLQLSGWDLISFQSFAEESGTLKKEITVSEKEISNALKEETPRELDVEKLPYPGAQLEVVRDSMEALLLPDQMVIVKQKTLGDKCAAIVAVERAEDQDSGTGFERILMIGLNGNASRDCEFTLKITDADNLVVNTLRITGYRQDWEFATSSDASASNGDKKDPQGGQTQTSSDGHEESDDDENDEDRGCVYVEDYTATYGEESLEGFVQAKVTMSLRARTMQAESNADRLPKMTAARGAYAVASVAGTRDAAAEIARIELAPVNGKGNEITVRSGEVAAVRANASCSATDNTGPAAYFAVEFKVSDAEKKFVLGPETDPGCRKEEAMTLDEAAGLAAARKALEESKYVASAKNTDWLLVPKGESQYFYSAEAMLAVFEVKPGNVAEDMQFDFSFKNGVTPDKVTITASPAVLNATALKEGNSENDTIYTGGSVLIKNKASFGWSPVKMELTGGPDMGALFPGKWKDLERTFQITTAPASVDGYGVLYTKKYTVLDEIKFENFYIDTTGYKIRSGENEVFLQKDGKKNVSLMKALLPSGIGVGSAVEPLYREGADQMTGLKISCEVENDSDGELTLKNRDGGNFIELTMSPGELIDAGMVKFENGKVPKLTNTATFDAYSVLHEPNSDLDESYRHVQSSAGVDLTASESYLISERAYSDEGLMQEIYLDQSVGAGSRVYYKIEAANYGYTGKVFRFVDSVPAGLDFDSVTLKRLTVGESSSNMASGVQEVKSRGDRTIAWSGIEISAGETAELVVSATIKNADDFKNGLASTEVSNIVRWYKDDGSALTNLLGMANARIAVAANVLSSNQIDFDKVLVGEDGALQPAVGSQVVYKLSTKIKDSAEVGQQRVTVHDEWPSNLVLTEIRGLSGATSIVLKQRGEEEIARYTGDGAAVFVPGDNASGVWFMKPNGERMDQTDVGRIDKIEISINTDKAGSDIYVTGRVGSAGVIANTGYITGGSHVKVEFAAVGMNLEKKAYHIPKGSAITEGNYAETAAESSTRFDAGDVVAYEINVTNTTEDEAAISPTVTDDLAQLFSGPDGNANTFRFAEATMNGNPGSVFYRQGQRDSAGGWTDEWHAVRTEDSSFKISHEFKNLGPNTVGTLLIFVEVPPGAVKEEIQDYTNEAKATASIGGTSYEILAQAQISTRLLTELPEASIENEVLAVGSKFTVQSYADSIQFLDAAKWTDEKLGEGPGLMKNGEPLPVGKNDYVLYRVRLSNNGNEPLRVYETENWLPDGMKLVNFQILSWKQKIAVAQDPDPNPEFSSLSLGSSAWKLPITSGSEKGKNANLYYVDKRYTEEPRGADAIMINTRMGYSVYWTGENTYRARLYRCKEDTKEVEWGATPVLDEDAVVTILPDSTIEFGLIAQVTGEFSVGTVLTGKAGLLVDRNVVSSNSKEKLTELPMMTGPEADVGGKGYDPENYRVLTDTAQVKIGDYRPGVEKSMTEFLKNEEWRPYSADSSDTPSKGSGKKADGDKDSETLLPTDWMRWQITLSNGKRGEELMSTAGSIETYRVTDVLPAGFKYNEEDLEGNVLIDSDGNKTKMPAPKVETRDGATVLSWEISKGADGKYEIIGKATVTTQYSLAIPAHKSVTVQIGTCSENKTAPFGTYVNRADLIVDKDRYPYEKQSAGILDEESGSVYALARVNVYGSGRTEAWKEVQYENSTARGTDSANNFVEAKEGGTVTYRLNVTRHSSNPMEYLVMIDHLPEKGDNGLVVSTKRKSDFAMKLASGGVSVKILKDGQTPTLMQKSDYTVRYGIWSDLLSEGSAVLPANQWDPAAMNAGKLWSESPEGRDCIRIEITNTSVLNNLDKGSTIVAEFSAKLPSLEEANEAEDAVAWNTFGYAYKISGGRQPIVVEPPKVGVKIKESVATLYVGKTVKSDLDSDKQEAFTFLLERSTLGADGKQTGWLPAKHVKYTLGGETHYTSSGDNGRQAGTFELSDGQTAVMTVAAGDSYRVKELTTDGYLVRTTMFAEVSLEGSALRDYNEKLADGIPTVEALIGREYYCNFTNIKNSLILPSTGGIGTEGFHLAGMLLMVSALLAMAGMCLIGRFGKRKRQKGRR